MLDTEFPYEKDRIFCEVIGLPGTGFFGTATQIKPVESGDFEHQKVQVIIWEAGNIIFDTVPPVSSFSLPYNIQNDMDYSIEVKYKDQIITSRQHKKAPPRFTIEALSVENEFIDSLGFHVTTTAFSFASPIGTGEELFYTYNIELLSIQTQSINIFGTEPGGNIEAGTTTLVSSRLPNLSDYALAQISLISLDKEFYQYLKNINRLGIIPNDEVEGHQGNLEGGIGYFGIVNFDVELVEF